MAKLIDETGNQYRYLKVLGPEKINNRTYWKCQCVCGKIITVLGGTLRNGNTKSCGCKKGLSISNAAKLIHKNMLNKQYGYLLVLDYDKTHYRDRHMICKCLACNTIKSIRAIDIKNGKIISCGCIHSKGNNFIKHFLEERNINFKNEYKISECKDKLPLPFDFAIFDENNRLLFLIEYQGKQHYGYENAGWDNKENFLKIQQHDKIKKDFCFNNQIKLITISYKENLQKRLEEIFNEL